MLRRRHSSRFPLRWMTLILVSTPFEHNRSFLPGRNSSPWDVGWAQYCATCTYIGVRYLSEILDGNPCSRMHFNTEVLISYVCRECGNELLFRKLIAPRRPTDIKCNNGIHAPKETLARKPGTDSKTTLPEI